MQSANISTLQENMDIMKLKTLIIGNADRNQRNYELLNKLKGELIMDDDKKLTIEMKPRSIKTVLQEWKDGLAKKGQRAFWASWLQGTYIKKDNLKAQSRAARLLNRKFPDIKEKVVSRHGKNVKILYNRKTGERIPTTGMSPATLAKIKAKNADIARQRLYFADKNHLNAIAAMMFMPRNLRRTLCRKLGLKWNQGKEAYIDVEAMLAE
jgi:hypothetical protein